MNGVRIWNTLKGSSGSKHQDATDKLNFGVDCGNVSEYFNNFYTSSIKNTPSSTPNVSIHEGFAV